jgi:DHA2 family multidrug resistance protein-like MFS transporter
MRDDAESTSNGKRLFAFSAVAVGTMMSILNGTITNVALPTIGRAFHVSAATSVWATNGFQAPAMMGLLAAAAIGQQYGFARLYRIGVIFYIIGSLVCIFAPAFPVLVAGRAVQGFGSAGIMSVGPAIIRQIFPRAMLGQALGWNALIVALSSASGPTVGGFVLAGLSWRWIFVLSIPFGIYSFVAGRIALHDKGARDGRVDVPSCVLSAFGLGLFVVSLDGFAHHVNPIVTGCGIALAAAALVAFVRRQSAIEDPVLPMDIFRVSKFSLAALTSASSFVAAMIGILSMPFFFQGVMGRTPLESGLLFAAWPIATAIAAPFSGRLADRIAPPLISTTGLALFTLGLGSLALLPSDPAILNILWREAICGIGFGIFQSPNNRELMTALPSQRSGNASGILALARLSGQTLGAAIVAIVFGLVGAKLIEQADVHSGASSDHAIVVTLWIATVVAGIACAVSATRLKRVGDRCASKPNAASALAEPDAQADLQPTKPN